MGSAGKMLLLLAASAGALNLASCRAQQSWPLWDTYAQHFIDGQGRVIDRSAGDRTTSEGQAYALFFALVENDRPRFDKLLAWTEANLAQGDLTLHLPGWEWGKTPAGEWKLHDPNSASDADLWFAYTLIEAGRLWHEPRFDTLGRVIAREIAGREVARIPGVGTFLAPGPSGFHTPAPSAPDATSAASVQWTLNPSYTPPPVLERLARAVPEGPWAEMQKSLPALTGGPASHAFAMDWVLADTSGVHASAPPNQPTAGAREQQPAGSYDAIRVYLWVGMSDPGATGIHTLDANLSGMSGYMRNASTPPLEVDPQGTAVKTDAPPGFSAAIVPFLQSIGMKEQAKAQADRLAATRDTASGLYGRSMEYYDQNLALFSTGWSEQRFRFERDGRLRVRWK